MRHARPLLSLLPGLALLVLAALLGGPRARAELAPESAATSASPTLAQLAERVWQRQLEEDPVARLHHGLEITNLPDLSLEHLRRDAAFARTLLTDLERIAPATLGEEDRLTWELLRWQAERDVEQPDLYWHRFEVTPYSAPFNTIELLFSSDRLATPHDLDNYLRLLHQVPAAIGQVRASLAGQRARHILLPKPEIELVVTMLRAYVRPPERNGLAVASERLTKLEPAAAAAFQAEVRRLVAAEINPAYETLLADLDEAYRKEAPAGVGIGQYPGGEAAYRLLIREQTTLDTAPSEIHRIGLAEVARIDREMATVRRRLGFAGTKAEFNQRLRSDPRFLARTPEEVGARLMQAIRRIEPKVASFFSRTPKAPYAVERLPPALEGGMTFGYYDVPNPSEPRGIYRFNGSHLDERPLVNAAALIYHELVPGHHFQLALQRENESLPAFRHELYHNVFAEGWAEYASALAAEMGMYDDPYDLYGRLAMDMFLSVRLVVDTGMNALGWSRERAVAFMRDNELESDAQIATESLRYAVDMPAQALGYKLGSMKIHELRERAQRELGSRFDIRRFHEAVLGSGSLPLPVLERHIDRWIALQKAVPAGGQDRPPL
jgi:uncharacterized protein (DUF885 family)